MTIVHQKCQQALLTKEQAQALLATIGPAHSVPQSVKESVFVVLPIQYEQGKVGGELIKLCSVLRVSKLKIFDENGKGRFMWLFDWSHGL
jgi:hypothetical protein